MRRELPALVIAAAVLAVTGCSPTTSGLESSSGSPSIGLDGSGVPLGEVMTVSLEQLRDALLGEKPYPSGWEAQVDELIADMRQQIEEIRVPDVTGMDAAAASCTLWNPLVGNTHWATGAFLERQVFIAHVAELARVAPGEIRFAADEASAIAAAAAAEQMKPNGDTTLVSRHPSAAIEVLGRWAVEHCEVPATAAEAPDTRGWTDADRTQSCDLDREGLANAQDEYRAGPGKGLYAEHPHLLEVTVRTYAYPSWHRSVVDNAADPPSLRVEPIPGGPCDR